MFIEQIYTPGIAEMSYYIESDNEAVVIDPVRDISKYLELSQKRNAKIKYIFETHFHADFVSGHLDLAKESGGRVVFGAGANTNYDVMMVKDEEVLVVGKVSFKVLLTPGHTPESTSFLLRDENQKDYALFTGDTLFVGDVGRPDLIGDGYTKTDLAGMLFLSLQQQILPISDEVLVYPGHGAGSACGKNISSKLSSTIGEQKRENYALQNLSKPEFVKQVVTGLKPPPVYFSHDAQMNKNGYANYEFVIQKSQNALKYEEFVNKKKDGVVIIDTRDPKTFANGYLKGSINIGLGDSFERWVGVLIDPKKFLLIISSPGKEKEIIKRLILIGYENIIGYLEEEIPKYDMEILNSISGEEFVKLNDDESLNVLDVRGVAELLEGKVHNSHNICLSELNHRLSELKKSEKYYVHCAGGYRSSIAVTFLNTKGFDNIVNISGGFNEIKKFSDLRLYNE